MRLDKGLFKVDFDDHHAVLGIPVTADAKIVRKRYLVIARKLHPDSLSSASDSDTQQASDLLSKWVNPAYEALSQEKAFTEHQIILKLKGQGLRRTGSPPEVTSEVAQSLLKAPQVEAAYRQMVNTIAANQYDQLGDVLERVGELSELNLVYLYRTSEGEAPARSGSASAPAASEAPGQATTKRPGQTQRKSQAEIVESYIKRAQDFELNRDYSRAVLEMREVLKTYPNNGSCHSYLAGLYLKAGQGTMARIHAKRALEINPNDEVAQAIQARLEKATAGPASQPTGKPADKGKPASKGNAAKGSAAPKGKADDKGSGGFFGLFGGKKK